LFGHKYVYNLKRGVVNYKHFADKGWWREGVSSDADIQTFCCKKLQNFQKSQCFCTDKSGGRLRHADII